ncbi:MAG: hypothetical protein ACOX1F_02885 [Erysipelotrichaceae bacterium]|jgi:hypothetical protein
MSSAEVTVKNPIRGCVYRPLIYFAGTYNMKESFKKRVKDTLIDSAKDYNNYFIGKKYIVYSKNFKIQKYYSIKAKCDNYLHITGILTNLNPTVFFKNI